MTIRSRLFLLSLCAFGLIGALALFGLQNLNERNFQDYRDTALRLGAAELAGLLAQEYQRRESWTNALREAWRWPQLYPPLEHRAARRPGPERLAGEGRRFDRPAPQHPPPRRAPVLDSDDGERVHRIYQLFDAQHQPLSSGPMSMDGVRTLAIDFQGETIGFLAWQAPAGEAQPLDVELKRRQQHGLLMISLGVLMAAALFAWVLAAGFTRRINSLASATRALAAGDLELRLGDESADELGELARGFEQMARSLQQAQQRERQWLVDIAHELRTPLSVLRGEIEAMQDGVRPVSQQQLASLRAEAVHLGTLINDLQTLSSTESGQLPLDCQRLNLRALIEEICLAHRAALDAAGFELSLEISADLQLHADEQRLRQVVDNLLQNLCRYAQPGAVRWSARPVAGFVELELADSGPGVAAQQMPRLFDRLYRADDARTRSQGGSGLGLAICRGIVEQHGGRIEALASSLGGWRYGLIGHVVKIMIRPIDSFVRLRRFDLPHKHQSPRRFAMPYSPQGLVGSDRRDILVAAILISPSGRNVPSRHVGFRRSALTAHARKTKAAPHSCHKAVL